MVPEGRPARDDDWLDADALYRCYKQIVRLEFHTASDNSDVRPRTEES